MQRTERTDEVGLSRVILPSLPVVAAVIAVGIPKSSGRVEGDPTSDALSVATLPQVDVALNNKSATGEIDPMILDISHLLESLKSQYKFDEQIWGSVDDPKFLIIDRNDYAPRRTYAGQIESFIQKAQSNLDAVQEDEIAIAEIKRGLESDDSQSSALETLRKLEELAKKYYVELPPKEKGKTFAKNSKLIHLREGRIGVLGTVESILTHKDEDKSKLDRDFLERFGPPENFARALFKELTGKEVPEMITFFASPDLPSDRNGESHEISGLIRFRPRNYIDTVITDLHELGHFSCRTHEAVLLSNALRGEELEVRAREEAGAFLFADCGGRLCKDERVREQFVFELSMWVETYYEAPEQSLSMMHSLGAAMADAALTIEPDPARAYKLLTTGYDLDPQIMDIIKLTQEKANKMMNINSETWNGRVSNTKLIRELVDKYLK